MMPALTFRRFRSWLHAEEEDAVVVYNDNPIAGFVFQLCVILGSCVFIPVMRRWIVLPVTLACAATAHTLVDARRAIIITPKAVVYRPRFGRPRRVAIAKIQGISHAKVLDYRYDEPVPGVLISLVNGEEEAFPLNFRARSRILEHIAAVAGKAIGE